MRSLHNRIARFLENQGYQAEALSISKDDEHRFELATQLGKLQMAADIIVSISAQANPAMPPRGKWKNLGDVALEQGDFALAKRCFSEAKARSRWHTRSYDALHTIYVMFASSYMAIAAIEDAQGLISVKQEVRQDLGALFLLYTSVGDAEGVMSTGKLAEARSKLAIYIEKPTAMSEMCCKSHRNGGASVSCRPLEGPSKAFKGL